MNKKTILYLRRHEGGIKKHLRSWSLRVCVLPEDAPMMRRCAPDLRLPGRAPRDVVLRTTRQLVAAASRTGRPLASVRAALLRCSIEEVMEVSTVVRADLQTCCKMRVSSSCKCGR